MILKAVAYLLHCWIQLALMKFLNPLIVCPQCFCNIAAAHCTVNLFSVLCFKIGLPAPENVFCFVKELSSIVVNTWTEVAEL